MRNSSIKGRNTLFRVHSSKLKIIDGTRIIGESPTPIMRTTPTLVLAVFLIAVGVNVEAFHLLNLLTGQNALSNLFRRPAKEEVIYVNANGGGGQGQGVYQGNQAFQGAAGYNQLELPNTQPIVQPIVLYVDSDQLQGQGYDHGYHKRRSSYGYANDDVY